MDTFDTSKQFAAPLDKVRKGEKAMVTKQGVPVAIPAGANTSVKLTHSEIVEGMWALRTRVKPGKMSVREMVNQGRF
jgi:antitoxin (DNA-binding transcriptional repressor) of toxin-antitoxin stability system